MWFFSDEELLLQQSVRKFSTAVLQPKAQQRDAEETFHREAFYQMGELGLLGITIPENQGGAGQGAVAATLVMEEMAAVDASTTLSYLAHTILCAHQLSQNGDEFQKKTYLPLLLSGEWIGGMGMSEPAAGSDALGMMTQATRQGSHYLIQGTKTWITNGPIGDFFYCYAKTGPGKKQISTFLIPRSTPGFSTGKQFSKMGMRGSPTGELIFANCLIPVTHRVGSENSSIPAMMKNLSLERITISGISLGIARSALEIATRYAQERHAFGKPIGAFQQIQERLAHASSQLAACRALTYQAAKMLDLGLIDDHGTGLLAAQAKLQAAPMATQVALDAIQILGGYGYTSEFPVERFMRDAKLIEIGAGTNEILRIIIARQLLGKQVIEMGA